MHAIGKRLTVGLLGLFFLVAASVPDPFVPTPAERERLKLMSQRESWFLANLAGPREVIDGQHLDPKIQYLFEQRRRRTPEDVKRGLDQFCSAEGRVAIRARLTREWALLTKVTEPMRNVEDRAVRGRGGKIPVRIYTPETDDPNPLPVLLYFHGGGWLYSNIEAVDRVARLIANEADAIVVSVDYRLAPDHRWPAANDDGEDVFHWARSTAASLGGDPEMIGVGGDSAGGHISLSISRRQLKANRPPPLYQLLYYTATDFEPRHPSYQLFGKGYGLDLSFRNFMMPLAFGGPETIARAADELNGKDMKGMPASIVVTAGIDVLRDPGQSLARRLERDGVAVTYLNYPTLAHGFLQWSGVVEDAERAAVETARLLGAAIRSRKRQLSLKTL